MLAAIGSIFKSYLFLSFCLLLFLSEKSFCQNILDSAFTFREGTVKTENALSIITAKTGFSFTYDSRLVDGEKKTVMDFKNTRLEDILKNILNNDSLRYLVLDNYIIISRPENTAPRQVNPASEPESYYMTGAIIDEETGEPLPFATLGLRNKGRGTVTNTDGEFGLSVSADEKSDTLVVSYLGYIAREIPVINALQNYYRISMRREFISIPGIIIKNQIPQEIISRARSHIPSNYGNTPALLTGFYREGVLEKGNLQNYSEAVLKIYKSAYSGAFLGDQMKIYKSRKIDNRDRTDTLALRLKAGLSTCLELDGAKNTFDFMKPENMAEYSYRMTDIVTYDEESAFVIDFEQRKDVDMPLYDGSLYINTEDYSILHAEFELNKALIHRMKDSFISNNTKGFNTWPVSVKYMVTYRKINGRYFLSHVRGDLLFYSKQKKKLFRTEFKVFFELAITDIELNDVKRFEREETAPLHSIFSKTINRYDPSFWGDQDFLRPEDDLLEAIRNLDVRIQEFSGSEN